MDTLPSAALEVIGQYLDPQDALGCRLAARNLAPVTAKQLPSSYISVVASSFQLQLQDESNTNSSISVARTAATATSADPPTQDVGRLLIASEDHQNQNAPVGEPATAAATALAAVAEGDDDITCSPTFRSRTAANLYKAAAAGYSKAFVYVDVLQEYSHQTWQELFGALLSGSSSISALTIVEYSSTRLNENIEHVMKKRLHHADLAPPVTAASSLEATAAAAAAVGIAGSSDWLPALVSAYTSVSPEIDPSLKHLELQLPAPLPVHLQALLLQLTGLRTLALYPTWPWPRLPEDPCPVEPVLGPHVVQGLTQLSSLESLTCCIGLPCILELSQAALMIQQAFSCLGRHMTHLSFGTSHAQIYYDPDPEPQVQLSAPLVSMNHLRSLICKRNFSLDTDDALKSLYRVSANAATSGTSAATGSSSSSPGLQIAPSLTKLVLNNARDHGSLLRLLAGKGISTAVAARSRSQLVHLELDCRWRSAISQLAMLRYLKVVVHYSDELTSLCNSTLTSQLQGLTLTLTCTDARHYFDASDVRYRPMQSVTSFTALISLSILAQHDVNLHPVEDLELLCCLTHLSHLRIEKHYGYDESIKLRPDAINTLPCGLQSLVLKLYPGSESPVSPHDRDEIPDLKFAVEAFPSGLTALEFVGVFVELLADNDDPVCHELEVARAMPCDGVGPKVSMARTFSSVGPATEAAPVIATHNRIPGNTGNSGVGVTFPGLKQLSANFSTTDRARESLRCCRNLQTLDIRLPIPACIKDLPVDANAVSLQLSEWCPLLNNSHLTLTGTPGRRFIFSEMRPADELFEMIWPGVPSLSGLQELAITVAGTLSHNTIVPCLSGLSCLTRLRDLKLQFKLEVSGLKAQYASKHQQGHEQEGHNAAANSSKGDEHPTSQSSHANEENAERGQPVTIDMLEVHSQGLLFNALRGCIGLRRLVFDVIIVMLEAGWPLDRGKNLISERMLDERSGIMLLEGGLRNCLVVGGYQHLDDS